MSVLKPVDPATATGESKEVLQIAEQRLKRVPAMIRVFANSPAITRLYFQFNETFQHTKMTPRLRGLIAAAIAEFHGCDYSLSAAMALGPREGVSEAELTAARRGEANDPQTAAALRFALAVAKERGQVPAAQTEELRKAGFTDEEIVELIAAVVLVTFRSYVNLVAGTEVDFPLVRTNKAA